jgi:hypothetical protein
MIGNKMIISVIYEEGEKDSYKRVEICHDGITIQFHSGEVVEDFYRAKQFAQICYEEKNIIGQVSHVMLSSSVDHFVQDNCGYGWYEDKRLGALIIEIE